MFLYCWHKVLGYSLHLNNKRNSSFFFLYLRMKERRGVEHGLLCFWCCCGNLAAETSLLRVNHWPVSFEREQVSSVNSFFGILIKNHGKSNSPTYCYYGSYSYALPDERHCRSSPPGGLCSCYLCSHLRLVSLSTLTFVNSDWSFFSALLVLVVGISVGVCLLMREKRKRIQEATSLQNLPWIDTLEVFAVTGRVSAVNHFEWKNVGYCLSIYQ